MIKDMIGNMNKFQPHICVDYPKNNDLIFEEWVSSLGEDLAICDRYLIPVHFTSYHVNNNYGNDKNAIKELQEFIDGLDRNKKWFSICQYDDSALIDFKDLDVMRFEMSKKIGTELPLLCRPHPYSFTSGKKYIASFIGSRTHPIRNELDRFKGKEGWYISFEPHDIIDYCRILHESVFALCPRGYGLNSFRTTEALQYNAIPIYISDEFIEPFGIDFNEIGFKVKPESIEYLPEILGVMSLNKQAKLKEWYESIYTYGGCFNKIMSTIENEYYLREQNRTTTATS